MTRRVLGDAAGSAVFVAPALLIWTLFPRTPIRVVELAAALMLVLLIFTYRLWLRWDREEMKWGRLMLWAVGLALGSLLIDIAAGRMIHPEMGWVLGTVLQPIFLATVVLCPVCMVLLAGWIRSAVLRRPDA